VTVMPLPAPDPAPSIPDFEGHQVHSTAVKIVGTIDLADLVVRMDDIVRLKVELRCINVGHGVDARGDLKRVQTLKVLEAEITPFVEGVDNGVFRG
jgi:hypothetical protein